MIIPAPAGRMTLQELQRLVLHLSNSSWCRFWVHYNHPQQVPHLMAIQCREHNGRIVQVRDMERHGFLFFRERGIYLINRINDDGTPFVSQI